MGTGLTRLSVALGKSTVEIYCDSPSLGAEEYWSIVIVKLGEKRNPSSVKNILNPYNNFFGWTV
jgi:hypothetical protein